MAVIEKFLPAPRKSRTVMSAHETGKGALPMDGQAFEAFQKFPI
jgi:hypothetical protein